VFDGDWYLGCLPLGTHSMTVSVKQGKGADSSTFATLYTRTFTFSNITNGSNTRLDIVVP
jgi:hypothetical protein